ncbi:hypothetical protein APHAL10511_008670 [Amanita phalloides]|nr:hypothetical protein APHAL10511_008670 [Amanita phalloides]
MMWLYGSGGSGKSAIAQTIAEHCSEAGKLAAAFFFSRTKLDSNTVDPLCRTLAWQLLHSIPETSAYIASAIKEDWLLRSKSESIILHFERLIVKPLEKALGGKRPQKHIVVIDGVGECGFELIQKRILKLIGETLLSQRITLRFLIASRPEAHICETFQSLNDIDHLSTIVRYALPDDHHTETLEDIRMYLKDELWRIYEARDIEPLLWLDESMIDTLVYEPPQRFLYAATVVMFVDDIDHDPRQRLDIVLRLHSAMIASPLVVQSTLVSTYPYAMLDALYMHILSQESVDYKFTMAVLKHIVGMPRPSTWSLKRSFKINEVELYAKIRSLYPLLRISGDVVEAYSNSFIEFLQDKSRAGKYYVGLLATTFNPTRIASQLVHSFRESPESALTAFTLP